MNSVFVRVDTAPIDISPFEMVVSKPDFLNEIKACHKKKGGSLRLGPNYLRSIAEEIGRNYDKKFNAYRHVVPNDHVGRICETDEEVAKVVEEMFNNTYPAIYSKYYETILTSRPFNVKIVYVIGQDVDLDVFKKLNISEISKDQIPAYLGDSVSKASDSLNSHQHSVESTDLKELNTSETLALLAEETHLVQTTELQSTYDTNTDIKVDTKPDVEIKQNNRIEIRDKNNIKNRHHNKKQQTSPQNN